VLPNSIAYVALFAWPLVCVVLFVQLPVEAAAIWSLLGGYLLLPSNLVVDAHVLPPLDKFSVSALSTFLLCWMKGRQSTPSRPPLLTYLFAIAFVLAPIFSTFNNSYELHIGDRSIPGFYPLDGLKMVGHNMVELMPFFVGAQFLSSERARTLLLKALPTAALFYSLPMLLEVRLSPQLQRLVYGSNPSGFITLARAGGYRPLVFLSTGLELAMFTSMAFIAAIVAMRARWRLFNVPDGTVATYLGGLLLLCKTLAAIIYGTAAAPLVFFTTPKTWVRVSSVVILIICAYPMLRTYDIIPVRRVAAAAGTVSADRAGSFQFRVENEDRLLNKANQKPFFGWGTWGRNRVFDKESGTDLSITDGGWIIRFGMYGWLGYLSLFGLFATAIFSARSGVKGPISSSTVVLGGLTIILAINLIDLIPNANLLPLTYMLAGSIAGRARVRRKAGARSVRAVPGATRTRMELAG
jgi:hypothetical protein